MLLVPLISRAAAARAWLAICARQTFCWAPVPANVGRCPVARTLKDGALQGVQQGAPPGVTLAARDLAVDINLVSGVKPTLDADTKVIDFTGGEEEFKVVTGTGKSITLDMAGDTGRLVRASGSMELNLSDFVQFSGSMQACAR